MEILNLSQFCAAVSISEPTARKLARRGEIEGAAFIGRSWQIPQAAVEIFKRRPKLKPGRPRLNASPVQ